MTMQEFYKRHYTTIEFYHILEAALQSMKKFKNAKDKNLISESFSEKLMLAVTEVNGCEVCNTFHVKKAKESGVKKSEIITLLSGGIKVGPSKEELAIDFAKKYASNNGKFDQFSWEHLVKQYGFETAEGILAAIRVIMMGNAYGIASGALLSRLKFKPIKSSNIFNEISVTLSILLFAPVLLIKNALGRN